MKTKRKSKVKAYRTKKKVIYRQKPEMLIGELSGLKGQFKPNLVPEIKVSYNKGKRVLGKIGHPGDAAGFIRKQYKRGSIETQEYFNVIYTDRKNSIIGYYRHSIGAISATVADLRIVFAVALKSLSTGMILSHNHPSGNLKPSVADEKLTQRYKEVAKLHEIELLDHIIVTKTGYYSFAEQGYL